MRIFSTRSRNFAGLGATALMLALTSCAMPTTYHPATGQGYDRSGYSDTAIEPDRYQIAFSGNSLTSRETVERYMLYRAAQLTLEKGYDYFILVDRNTEKKSRTVVDGGFTGGPWGGWGARWRYYSPRWGWGFYDPFYDPFWDRQVDVRTINRYQAVAEIKLGKGEKPLNNLHAFNARDVVANLGPSIQLPKQR